jgi:hypothetical protein
MFVDSLGGLWLSAPLALIVTTAALGLVVWADSGFGKPGVRRNASRSGESGLGGRNTRTLVAYAPVRAGRPGRPANVVRLNRRTRPAQRPWFSSAKTA